jgi:hypothetical protein
MARLEAGQPAIDTGGVSRPRRLIIGGLIAAGLGFAASWIGLAAGFSSMDNPGSAFADLGVLLYVGPVVMAAGITTIGIGVARWIWSSLRHARASRVPKE